MDDSSKENVELNDFKSEEIVEAWQEEECGDDDILCRACGNSSKNFIRIFEAEGIDHGLEYKINQHLPIKISEKDELPKNMCYTCASTLIAFHELVDTCIEADTKLREMFNLTPKQKLEPTADEEESDKQSLNDEPFMDNESIDAGSDVDDMEDSSLKESSEILPNDESNVLDNEELSVEQDIEMDASTDPLELPSSEAVADDLAVPSTSKGFVSEGTRSSKKAATKRTLIEGDRIGARNNFRGERNGTSDLTGVSNKVKFKDGLNVKTKEGALSKQKKPKKMYKCLKCNVLSPSMDMYVSHFNESHRNKPSASLEKYKVSEKDADMTTESNVSLVIEYVCCVCLSVFKEIGDLKMHVESHGINVFVCEQCGKTFENQSAHKRHVEYFHSASKNFACDICGRRFSHKRYVAEHRIIHTGECPFACDECDESFRSKKQLLIHQHNSHNFYPFSCAPCNRKFKTRQSYNIHMALHSGEKLYKCDVCKAKFGSVTALSKHKWIHREDNPFSCELCHLSFKVKRYLRNHLIRKHKERPDLLVNMYS